MIYQLQKHKKSWFTLIELIITITIASIIIVSVVDVFILSTDISMKTDINRNMQKNIKNVVEFIAEDIRKNWVGSWVAVDLSADCTLLPSWTNNYSTWSKLCNSSWNEYYLAMQRDYTTRQTNKQCLDNAINNDRCTIIVNDGLEKSPLSNSSVTFTNLVFYLSNDKIPKVTISFTAKPALWKWVKANLIKDTEIKFQTTITERFIKSY